eukprot:3093092-Alexandrium_andersonii.AAC.1
MRPAQQAHLMKDHRTQAHVPPPQPVCWPIPQRDWPENERARSRVVQVGPNEAARQVRRDAEAAAEGPGARAVCAPA